MVIWCGADLLVKCKGMTDPTLSVAVDKIKKTVSACTCGLKYTELTEKVAEQTATTGASDICSAEIQKIIKGTVCLRVNKSVGKRSENMCLILCVVVLYPFIRILVLPNYSCIIPVTLIFACSYSRNALPPLPPQPSLTTAMTVSVVVQI